MVKRHRAVKDSSFSLNPSAEENLSEGECEGNYDSAYSHKIQDSVCMLLYV